MCLLTFLPAGQQPDLTALRTGAACNPDGHGYAIVTTSAPGVGERLLVVKGLDANAVLERFAHDRATHPAGPALFHSRLATHGRVDEANCHPFRVAGDERTVIAHNGILPPGVRPNRTDPRSDTRIAADDYLPALGPLHLRRTRLKAERWMGLANLMVLLTVDSRYRRHAYLFNEASGLWDDGIWYSNDSYLPPPASQPLGTRSWWEATPPRTHAGTLTCASCGTIADPEQEWCPWCGHCWACAEPPDQCDCWTPAVLTHPTPHAHR
jgi:Glutamine amidotransferases class-II